MVETFIRRPVLSLVISIIITLLGVLALFSLPITQFPDIVPPSVVVTATYNGANAEVCTNAVAIPIERAVNGVPGMTYMNTVSSNNGVTLIQIFFKVGTDPDQAAVNVQNRVTTVLDELPEEVIRAGVQAEKEVNSMLLYLNIVSTNDDADEEFIYNFTDINVLHELKRIEGVGFVDIMGARDYSIRVWLKPDRMLAYNISTDEVIKSLRAQNIDAAPGVAGENSGKDRQVKQYVLKYTGKFNTPEQYGDVVMKAQADGSVLRLKDIADIEFGTFSYDMVSKTDGRPSASIMIKQRPGSNAREVIQNIKDKMGELKSTVFPPGMDYNFAYDVSRFLDASIHEVIRTLIEAMVLVFVVVFIFLQDFRSTLIPALAVPVALVGTLAFMLALDFSINMLTLFALVLAIGIVVDNAIVVVEAVHVKMEKDKLPPLEATIAAMKEITSAIIAITLVMSAVFIPVAFLSGPVGVFYRQFSITLAISIVISGINALTLTPALCALMLKPHSPAHTRRNLLARFFHGFNKAYNKTENAYTGIVSKIARKKIITLGAILLFVLGSWFLLRALPSGFIPTEDQSIIYVNVTTPAGSTLERTELVLDEVESKLGKLAGVDNISTLAGYSLMSEITGASYGMAMINLKGWEERKESVEELIAHFAKNTSGISDATIEYFAPPSVPGFGNASGFEFRLLNKNRSGNLEEMAVVTKNFLEELNKDKRIGGAFTGFDPSFPQYIIHVDQEMAAKKGVTVENAMNTLQTLMGSYYATNFIRFGQMYKVMLQALPEYRRTPDDLLKLYVKNERGEMVAFSTFTRLERILGPEQITRYNMYNAAMINGDASPGNSTSEAITAIQETTKKLPAGYDYEWSGMTREQILSGNQAIWIFMLCLLFVYLLLAAQYESFLLPLPVILSLPVGIFGALFFLWLGGLENNIYAQVAMVMLIGLLGKNAILIVEFAIQDRKRGLSIVHAAKMGAKARLRPILMTSFAFVAGLIPLCIASGAGAIGNRTIGMTSAGGMLLGTVIGVIVVPGLYVVFAKMAESGRFKRRIKTQLNRPPEKLKELPA
ncbi:efflux RND transporter permease subunit [Pollutibacter soli]|uniref:efflux RND transporter permease subunit n=1 Tax=Pollutibacter soli TaxID=3034157 RepID=UPI0030135D1B